MAKKTVNQITRDGTSCGIQPQNCESQGAASLQLLLGGSVRLLVVWVPYRAGFRSCYSSHLLDQDPSSHSWWFIITSDLVELFSSAHTINFRLIRAFFSSFPSLEKKNCNLLSCNSCTIADRASHWDLSLGWNEAGMCLMVKKINSSVYLAKATLFSKWKILQSFQSATYLNQCHLTSTNRKEHRTSHIVY